MKPGALLADFYLFAAGREASLDVEGGERRATARASRRENEHDDVRTVERRVDPDAALVPAIRNGDERAFRTLFDQYVDRMITFATTLTHDRSAAHDIVADVFFALWRIHESWCPDRVAVYLFGAVRNRCYNHKMSLLARRETTLDVVESSAAPRESVAMRDGAIDADALLARVEAVLATQPPQRRAVALLRWREELSFAEIAVTLGISENAARLHVSRALAAIRHLLPAG